MRILVGRSGVATLQSTLSSPDPGVPTALKLGSRAAGLAVLVFTKGMRHYERTGSQRYRAMGHRG